MKFPPEPLSRRERRLRRWLVAWIVTAIIALVTLVILALMAPGCMIGRLTIQNYKTEVRTEGAGHVIGARGAATSQPAEGDMELSPARGLESITSPIVGGEAPVVSVPTAPTSQNTP